jgi:putative transposase
VSERKELVDRECELSVRRQADILEVGRSSLYYRPLGESAANLDLMDKMDKLFLDDPTLGVIGMQDELRDVGLVHNVKRIRRLLRKMGIEPIYPKPNLSRLGKAKYVRPYLLRNLAITRPNQVWAIDITYVPMAKGFMYLTAIIDVYSRYIVAWQVSNSLEKETQTELLLTAIARHGAPEIVNSDQGSQYTSANWLDTLKENGIRVSMDGRGRATDNAFIERFFRTIKQKHIYLRPAKDGLELHQGIATFMEKYNRRRHQGIDRKKPCDLYRKAA